jgi:hypothetical protein
MCPVADFACACRVKLVDCDPESSEAISKLGFDPLLAPAGSILYVICIFWACFVKCRVKLVDCDPESSEAISKLGFDPLLELPSLEQFAAALAAKSKGAARLKPLLLDQVWCGSVVDSMCCRKVPHI